MPERMFEATKTWNPFTGCDHDCPYCWAREKMLPRLRDTPKYARGFTPTVHWDTLRKGPPICDEPNIFVVDMGDAFCGGFRTSDIVDLIDICKKSTHIRNFLFLTKNPPRFLEILSRRPDFANDGRFVFGATIETTFNREGKYEKQLAPNAPEPFARANAMTDLRYKYPNLRLFLCLEPIMEFDMREMINWIERIKPEFTYIGYDNHNLVSRWVEPKRERVQTLCKLIEGLTKIRLKTIRERK